MNEKLFNSDYLLHLCKKFDLRPSKKYGQNYLISPAVIEHILEVSRVTKSDTVVEVGPGFGVLTMPLTEAAGGVISFEIEKKLEPYWAEQKIDNLEVVWGNVLKQASELESRVQNYKVVANLPYQITSPVLRFFLEEVQVKPTEMILMVQKEVAERICAVPGDMSLLAFSVQYYAAPEYLFTVPRTDFWPSPQVDSAVIKIVTKKEASLPEVDRDFLFRIVKAGFAQRRKLLLKNLEPIVGKKQKVALKQIFEDLGLAPTVRAQELSVEEWVELAKVIPT